MVAGSSGWRVGRSISPWTGRGSPACRASRRPTGPWSASTRRRPGSRPPPAPSRSSSGWAGGKATGSGRSSCCSPTMRTRAPCSTSSPGTCRATAGSSRTTAAGSTGRCSSRGTGSPGAQRPCTRATLTCCRSCAACSVTGWTMPGCRPWSGRCSGSNGTMTSMAGRSPAGTSGSCAAGRPSRWPRWCATTTRTSGRWPA